MKAIKEKDRIRIGIPRNYNGIINYNTLSNERFEIDGWRDIVEPNYNTETQKKVELYFDDKNNFFTYRIIDKTQEEINQYKEDLLNSDLSANIRQLQISDGSEIFEKFLVYIQRRFDKKTLTGQQTMQCFNLLYTPLLPLKDGMFRIAQSNLNSIPNPVNSSVLEVFNLAKKQVSDYINNNQ